MSTLNVHTTRRRPASFAAGLGTRNPPQAARPRLTHSGAGQAYLAMPFDALRFQYAGAVSAGLVPRSILASGRSERSIDLLEKLILGPVARQR